MTATAGAGYASPVVTVDGVPTAVVEVTKSPTQEAVDVVSLSGPAASVEASLAIPLQAGAISSLPFVKPSDAKSTGASPASAGDITGDGQPDFLVLVEAADNFPGIVVSNEGGTWRLVPTSASDTSMVFIGRDPKISGGHLTSTDCGGPACAPSITKSWTYVKSGGGYLTSS